MRFSVCLRLTRSLGFFWGTTFVPYSAPLAGFRGSAGYRVFWRGVVFSLAEGSFIRLATPTTNYSRTRLQSLGRTLLFFAPGHIPVTYP